MIHTLRRWFIHRPARPIARSATLDGQRILAELHTLALWPIQDDPNLNGLIGNPLDHIGTSLRLAKHYGIELRGGITFGSCQAYLPEERHKKPAVNVSFGWLGDWMDRGEPCEAICCVLLSCRKLGLL